MASIAIVLFGVLIGGVLGAIMCIATCTDSCRAKNDYYETRIDSLKSENKKLKDDLAKTWKEIGHKNDTIKKLSEYSQKRCRANFIDWERWEDDGK